MDAQNNAGYLRWKNTEWWQDGYEKLWQDALPTEETSHKEQEDENGNNAAADGGQKPEHVAKSPKKPRKNLQRERSQCAQGTVVYLTADADDELHELREGETYIIGGIVDHNRYKVFEFFVRVRPGD